MQSLEKNKDWWAPVWSGLILDPKHQMRMDRAIWVYLYLQTYADRKTGRLFRKYQDIADETGRSFNTIRRHMEKLLSLGYIEMNRKQYGFEIQITKWKPITTPKLAPKDGQCESNEPTRLPILGQSEQIQSAHSEVSECPSVTPRLPKGGQSEQIHSAHSTDSHCPFGTPRVPKGGQSPIRKLKESKEIIKKVVVETVNVDTESDRFLKFAGKVHQNIRHCNLFSEGERNRERVKEMLTRVPYRTLCVAWVLFLRSDDEYIQTHYPSRNISVFKAQLRNFHFPAESKLAGIRARSTIRAKSREPTDSVNQIQAEKWDECLRQIECQILPENFSALFEPLVFGGIDQGRGVIICPDKWSSKVIRENYFELIEAVMAGIFGERVKPKILIDYCKPAVCVM